VIFCLGKLQEIHYGNITCVTETLHVLSSCYNFTKKNWKKTTQKRFS